MLNDSELIAFATDTACSFGYPEFDTPDAADCTMYAAKYTTLLETLAA